MGHIGLRNIIDFVLAVPAYGVHEVIDVILGPDKDDRFAGRIGGGSRIKSGGRVRGYREGQDHENGFRIVTHVWKVLFGEYFSNAYWGSLRL